ncbi:helix-turn-helix domain-containing protein [Corynebacterium hadale]|uniref:helix-turn-helix domain-containing protein n=1 Tax=Corynebacterium hadale TaxID=2026255 RepID=UPI001EF3A4EB|nr:helix-turn-helix domain-containing protein [Corynebacterium hadale]MCG7265185.1 helix-turn-helix domain-containing protein [Corynebacterium hadale]
MTDYRAVMDLVLKGWSVRQITAAMGCSHSTVQKVRKVLQAEQITTTAQIEASWV